MLNFTKLGLEHIDTIRPYFAYAGSRICDDTAGVAVMWREFFGTEFDVTDQTLILRFNIGGESSFAMPRGLNVDKCLVSIDEYCAAQGKPPVFFAVTEGDIEILRSRYSAEIASEPEWSDYLYRAGDLRDFAGRRYHGKRNHINAFRSEYPDYSFEELHDANIAETIDFFTRTFSETDKDSPLYAGEYNYVLDVLRNYGAYGFCGGLLRTGGKPAAFSIGETVGDTLFVHIEKADTAYRGIYSVIVNEFVKKFASAGVEYVNREEDLGDEGLRQSKLSYHPCEIIKKYHVKVTR